MAEIGAETNLNKGLRQRFQQQPVRMRVLVVLFTLLLGCDLLVMAITLDWPRAILPGVVQLSGWTVHILSGLHKEAPPEIEAAWAPSVAATVGATKTPTRPEPARQLPPPGLAGAAAAISPTPFTPETYTPTATETPLPTATPEPTATEEPPPAEQPVMEEQSAPEEQVSLADTAMVDGVTGYYQSLPLSCESRSAVDWARFFGYELSELDFQYALPFTDNPATGFVGNPRDMAGGIPPNSYGVYAGPIATLLRAYGVPAQDYHWLSYDDLRREISEGRPVIVWVVGSVWEGSGVAYTASDGETVTVAALEHTVMVVGYTPDVVVIQDGGGRYNVPVDRFQRSWGVLENMAVLSH
jgi:uncharacterized protein YvpB